MLWAYGLAAFPASETKKTPLAKVVDMDRGTDGVVRIVGVFLGDVTLTSDASLDTFSATNFEYFVLAIRP